MTHFLILFLILVSGLAVVIVGVGEVCWYGKDADIDRQYFNEDGDHVYYDRSLIEKKIFKRLHPHIKNIRTLRRLFAKSELT